MNRSPWPRRLFFALALCSVLPFWTVRHLPTLDGPVHLYNAWVLRQSGNVEAFPRFAEHYEINRRPFPNWTGHAALAGLMLAVPPRAAEKLLVSGYSLLFLGGLWSLVGAVRPGERWVAFLAFPFVWNHLFQLGFYNFALSVAFFPWILGCWWRHRQTPGLAFAVKINLLLVLCYFSHILSFVIALAALGVLWLLTLDRDGWKRHLLHVPILLPQIILPLWFLLQKTGGEIPATWGWRRLLRYFCNLQVLVTLDDSQRLLARGVAVLILGLVLLTLGRKLRRREGFVPEDGFLLLALLAVFLYASSPHGLAGGSILKPRLSLYPWLLVIPWLSPGLGRRGERIAIPLLSLAVLGQTAFMTRLYRDNGREVERFLEALEPVKPNTRVLAILFETPQPTPYLNHALGYVALEKGLIDWDNYEAKTSFFPTRFRPSVVFPEMLRKAQPLHEVRPRKDVGRIDAFYVWRMPPGHPFRERLGRLYDRVSEREGGELFEIRKTGPYAPLPGRTLP